MSELELTDCEDIIVKLLGNQNDLIEILKSDSKRRIEEKRICDNSLHIAKKYIDSILGTLDVNRAELNPDEIFGVIVNAQKQARELKNRLQEGE